MREKQLRVALDVFAAEPATSTGEFADPIVQEPGVYGTHHIGASTDQAQEAIAAETVRIVETYSRHGKAPNAVNVSNDLGVMFWRLKRHAEVVLCSLPSRSQESPECP